MKFRLKRRRDALFEHEEGVGFLGTLSSGGSCERGEFQKAGVISTVSLEFLMITCFCIELYLADSMITTLYTSQQYISRTSILTSKSTTAL
jgi:hypothetical protein